MTGGRVQVNKSEQITSDCSVVIDYDQPLLKREDILNAFKSSLGQNCTVEKYGTHVVYTFSHNGIKEYFLTSSITYLSKPHPIFKKRCQTKIWFKNFYNEFKDKPDTRIRLVGIYHYEGLIVFVEFKIDDYLKRKSNSSAAHVFSNDIYQALSNGIFEKFDKNKNHITVIRKENFKQYLIGNVKGNYLLDVFKNFNSEFPFNQWITAEYAISAMKSENWPKWKETEWAGWYLEFLFYKYLKKNNISDVVYTGMQTKIDKLDFDVHFTGECFYGDLKSSDISKKDSPGNDQENVLAAISKHKKLWYIIFEHETIKDTARDCEMAKKRMDLVGTPYVDGGHICYQKRMKHSVRFKRMIILELNNINMSEVLKEFRQGHQPSGDARKPKFLIDKQNIDNCIILSYSPDDEL